MAAQVAAPADARGGRISADLDADLDDKNATQEVLATTNYGAQIAYNYGSVSNYFCSSSDGAHQCHFPDASDKKRGVDARFYRMIDEARQLYKARRWNHAKALFEEVIHAPFGSLESTERILLQYNLAHTHFALREFSDAACQFRDILDIYQERNEIAEESVSDSRYWLARSFFHLKQYADASDEFQYFIMTHDQRAADSVEQVTAGQLWLGLTFERLNRHRLAKEQLSAAFEERVRRLGPEHLSTLASRHHLANFLYQRKAYLEAEEHFRALLLKEDNLRGPEKGEAMRTRTMLAFCLVNLNRYDEAEPYLQHAYARIETLPYIVDDELREAGLTCYWLGRIALTKENMHSVDDAGFMFQRALGMLSGLDDLLEKSESYHRGRGDGGNNSSAHDDDLRDEVVGCRCYQAKVMRLQRRYVAAEHAYRQILDAPTGIRQEYLIASRHGLAASLISRRKLAEAKSVLDNVVSLTTPLDGCQYTGEDLAACMHVLGEIHLQSEQFCNARDAFQRVVDAAPEQQEQQQQQQQQQGTQIDLSRFCLGIALFRLREFESAQSYFSKVVKGVVESSDRARLRNEAECWLGWCLCEVGKYGEAEPYLQTVFTALSATPDGTLASNEEFLLGYSHFYQGRVSLHRPNLEEAIKHLRLGMSRVIRCEGPKSPTYVECRYYLAYCLYLHRDYGEARQILEDLQTAEATEEPVPQIRLILAPCWLGRITQSVGQRIEAEGHFSKCLQSLTQDKLPLHPETPAGYVRSWHANSLYQLDRVEECSKIVRHILDELKEDDLESCLLELRKQCQLQLGHSLHATENFEESCDYLTQTVKDLENSYGADDNHVSVSRALLVDSYSELGRHDVAAPHLIQLQTVQDLTPGTNRNIVKAVTSYWLGRRAFRNHWLGQEQAKGHFLTAQKSLVGCTKARFKSMRIDCQHFLARFPLRNKQHTDADVMLRELARQQYESGDVAHAVDNQFWLGHSLYMQNMYTAAIPVFQKVASDNKAGRLETHAVAQSFQLIGHALFGQEKMSEAKHHYKQALEASIPPSNILNVRLSIANCNFKLGLHDEAKDQYRLYLDQAPKNSEYIPFVQYWLGRTLFELREWKQACNHLKFAALDSGKHKLADTDALDAQYYLGCAQFNMGNYDEALPPLLSIMPRFSDSSSPTLAFSQYYTARAWYELGQFTSARQKLVWTRTKLREQKSTSTKDILAVDFWIARCLVGMGFYVKAKTELERIIAIPWHTMRAEQDDQTIMLAQYDLARIAYRFNHWSLALDLLQTALIAHETTHAATSTLDQVQCHRYLALVLQALQRKDEAMHFYQMVLDSQTGDLVQPPRQSLLDVQFCLSRTQYRLEERAGYANVTQEASSGYENLSGPTHPYSIRQQILTADLALHVSDMQRAEELYTKVLAIMETTKEGRRTTPVPLGYLRTALAVTLSKLGKTDEAHKLATKALENDCKHGHRCLSFEGFAKAFPDLVLSTLSASDSASDPASEQAVSVPCPTAGTRETALPSPTTKLKSLPPASMRINKPKT